MANTKRTIATWHVELLDLNDNEYHLVFDIVYGDESLVVGWNILKHSHNIQLTPKPKLVIKTPEMNAALEFASYSNPGEDRPSLLIVLPEQRKRSSMTGQASREKAAPMRPTFW